MLARLERLTDKSRHGTLSSLGTQHSKLKFGGVIGVEWHLAI
jgi:hypothetical protein